MNWLSQFVKSKLRCPNCSGRDITTRKRPMPNGEVWTLARCHECAHRWREDKKQ